MPVSQRLCAVIAACSTGLGACVPAMAAGRIVAAHDEWTLSNAGFSSPSDPGIFALNTVEFLTGARAANLLIYSANFGLTQSLLKDTLTGAGHTVTISTATPFTLENLLTFDAVFVTGINFDDQVMIDYVEAGGGVYICAGTGNATDTQNNTFMNQFGLQFNGLNGIGGHREINNPHPIFAGVDHLYENNGSSITDLDPNDNAQIVISSNTGLGLYAVYDGAGCPVPSPDLNGDGSVTGADLGLLLADWGPCASACCPADLNQDGEVTGADLGLFLAAWTG